jgi:hypothetical protein
MQDEHNAHNRVADLREAIEDLDDDMEVWFVLQSGEEYRWIVRRTLSHSTEDPTDEHPAGRLLLPVGPV